MPRLDLYIGQTRINILLDIVVPVKRPVKKGITGTFVCKGILLGCTTFQFFL